MANSNSRIIPVFAVVVLALTACGDGAGDQRAVDALVGPRPAPTTTPRPTIQPGPTAPADVGGGTPSLHGPDEACVFPTSYIPVDGWREHRPTDGGQTVWVAPKCNWVKIVVPTPTPDINPED